MIRFLLACLAFGCVAGVICPDSSASAAIPAEGLVIFDENPFNGSPRGLYRFDEGTHQLSLITEVAETSDRLNGFVWHPQKQRVIAGSEEGRLYSIDLPTGIVTLIGQAPVESPIRFIRSLAIEPATGQLYGLGFGPRLYRIDADTADTELLGVVPEVDGGLAFAPDGALYGWSPLARLLTIDPVTLDTTEIGTTPFGYASNLTSGPDGTLYGSGWSNGEILRIDRTTGVGESIAAFPEHTNGLIGVFYYSIPEPSASSLLLTAMMIVCSRSRCQRPFVLLKNGAASAKKTPTIAWSNRGATR